MDWNCTITDERLSDFLEGGLAAEERATCAAHASGCTRCSELLARVGELVGQMHALEPLPEPSLLARRIINGTARARTQRHELASVTGWFNLIWQPRFAMGVATVAVTLVILAHAAGARLSNLKPSDLNPVNLVRAGNRQAHLTYARGEKFVSDLRVVYEIRAVLAAPQPAPSEPKNQPAAPNGTRPDTGARNTRDSEQEAETQTPASRTDWAMLPSPHGGNAASTANRRTL
jgi:anti-sigma factor RsiW